jgi:hypothetical protein
MPNLFCLAYDELKKNRNNKLDIVDDFFKKALKIRRTMDKLEKQKEIYMKKKELIQAVANSMRGDICNYEDVIFELVEIGLKNWSVKELKEFLG